MSNIDAETAVSYAALILADASIAITPEKLQALLKAAGVEDVEPIWTTLFAKALDGKNIHVRLSPYQEWNIGSVHQIRLSMSINADVVEQEILTTTITTPSDPTAKLEGADAHTGDQKDGDVEKETAASGEEGEESDEDLGNLFDL